MDTKTITRRFIAAASCPKCKQLDKIVLVKTPLEYWYECVACGHVEAGESSASSADVVSVVKIIDSGAP